MHTFRSALVTAIVLAAAQGTSAAKISSISYSGDGCPSNSASIQLNLKGDVATLIFDIFTLDSNLDSDDEDDTSCDIQVKLDKSAGTGSFNLKTDIRGYATVEQGIKGSISASVGASSQKQIGSPKTITYPYSDDYLWSSQVGIPGGGSSFTLHTTLQFNSGDDEGDGKLTVDSIDITLQ